jgi:hypothetical protein
MISSRIIFCKFTVFALKALEILSYLEFNTSLVTLEVVIIKLYIVSKTENSVSIFTDFI